MVNPNSHHQWKTSPLIEDNSFVTIQQDAPFGNIFHSCGKDVALNIAPRVGQLFRTHAMVHSHNILLDDRTLIEVAGDEMGSGADDLDTAIISLVIGLGALERGQEAVVDIDDASGHGLAQRGGKNLHVASQNDEIDIVLAHEVQDLGLLLSLGLGRDREMMEGNIVRGGEGRKVWVVRDDDRNLNVQLAG